MIKPYYYPSAITLLNCPNPRSFWPTGVHSGFCRHLEKGVKLRSRLLHSTAVCLRSNWPDASSSAALLDCFKKSKQYMWFDVKNHRMPSKFCSVPFCANKKGRNHTFPTLKDLRQKWLEKCCLHEFMITKSSKVCHLHFLQSDYNKVKLKDGTFPTQNLPVGHFEPFYIVTNQTLYAQSANHKKFR